MWLYINSNRLRLSVRPPVKMTPLQGWQDSVFASRAGDRSFEPQLGSSKACDIGMCSSSMFSAKHAALKSKIQDCSARARIMCTDRVTCLPLDCYLVTNTLKIRLSVLVLFITEFIFMLHLRVFILNMYLVDNER